MTTVKTENEIGPKHDDSIVTSTDVDALLNESLLIIMARAVQRANEKKA